MRHYKPMTRAQRDARAERRRQAAEDAGIPVREDDDNRKPWPLDLSAVGGPVLTMEPRRGYISWRARDISSGEVLACGAIKTLLHRLADELPRTLGRRNW